MEDPLETGQHAMEVLMQAMTECHKHNQVRITELSVRKDARPEWWQSEKVTVWLPSTLAEVSSETVSTAIQHLRKLELKSIYYTLAEIYHHDNQRWIEWYNEKIGAKSKDDGETDPTGGWGSTRMIGTMLESATLLEDLTLILIDDWRDHRRAYDTPYIPLSILRGTNPLKHLSRLLIGNFKLEEPQFVDFLLYLSTSLRDFVADGIVLYPGTWASAFNTLKGQLPNLELCKIDSRGIWDAGVEVGEEDSYCWKDYIQEVHTDWDEYGHLAWFKEGKGEHPLKSELEERLLRENENY